MVLKFKNLWLFFFFFHIVKKLAGASARTAAWATNVGNEFGQVLMSVLTASEGGGLKDMAAGIMGRYCSAGVVAPTILYTDRDCCGERGVRQLFDQWSELKVGLDAWHWMRRIAAAVTTESHPLYAPFMAQLSQCVFEWSETDMALLVKAKNNDLRAAGVGGLPEADVVRRLSKN